MRSCSPIYDIRCQFDLNSLKNFLKSESFSELYYINYSQIFLESTVGTLLLSFTFFTYIIILYLLSLFPSLIFADRETEALGRKWFRVKSLGFEYKVRKPRFKYQFCRLLAFGKSLDLAKPISSSVNLSYYHRILL